MMHFNSLKKLAALAALALLAACGGGGGGGSDSGGNNSGGGPGGGSSASVSYYGISIVPRTYSYSLEEGIIYELLNIKVAPGQPIPASTFVAVHTDGSFRPLTMADIRIEQYQIDNNEVWVDDSSFAVNNEGHYSFAFANSSNSSNASISVEVQADLPTHDAPFVSFSAAFESDSSVQTVSLSREIYWSDEQRNIALPTGSRLGLGGYTTTLIPVSMSSPELGIDWKLGDPAPKLTQEGQGELRIHHMWSDEPVVVSISVYGQLKNVRLDAGYDVNGTATLFPTVYNPYRVIGSTELGNEIDLTALYLLADDLNDKYHMAMRKMTTSKSPGQQDIFRMKLGEFALNNTYGGEVNDEAVRLMGLSSDELTLDVDIQYLERLELGQQYYYIAVGEEIPAIDLDGYYGGKKFDVESPFYFYDDAVVDRSSNTAYKKGIINYEFSTNTTTNSHVMRTAILEVGDLTPTDLKGRWQYLDDGSTRIIGSHLAVDMDFLDEAKNMLKEGNRYLARVGIPNVDVKAKAEILGGDAITGRSTSDSSTRKVSTRIGGGNVIFKNVATGETKDVSPTDGVIDIDLPTGDYLVSSQVEVIGDDGEVEYVTFDAPVVVDGAAVDLGTFTAVGANTYNFKATLKADTVSNHGPEIAFYGSNDGSIRYGYVEGAGNSGTEYARTYIEITNIGSADASGLTIEVSADNSNGIFRDGTFEADPPPGGMSPGGSKSVPVEFKLNKPAEDSQARINIKITDRYQNVWNDYVLLNVSSEDALEIDLLADGGEGNGYIVAPGRKLIPLKFSNSNRKYRVPASNTDGSYTLILSNVSASNESVYGIGVGVAADSNAVDNYDTATGVLKNEPTDDTFEGAISLDTASNNTYESYLLTPDVDYYSIAVGQK